jgi:hypothetical protein
MGGAGSHTYLRTVYEILFVTKQQKHGDDEDYEIIVDKFEIVWDL